MGQTLRPWRCDIDKSGKIDAGDFAWFADYWPREDCNYPEWCNGIDFTETGTIGFDNLRFLMQNWLDDSFAAPPWFDCWDCPYQCHGDADCAPQGSPIFGFYRVYTNDLPILIASQGTCYGDPGYDPCADFNRDLCVDEYDEAILTTWYHVSDVPADCPIR